MAGPIPSWRGISIRRSHLGIAASMIVKGFGRLPKDWLISHSRLPHRAASSGVVVRDRLAFFLPRQPTHQPPHTRPLYPTRLHLAQLVITTRQPTTTQHPRKTALHQPTTRQHHKTLPLTKHTVQRYTKLTQQPLQQALLVIRPIRDHYLRRRIPTQHRLQHHTRPARVRHLRRRHPHPKHTALRVHHDVPLAPFYLLAPVIPACPPFAVDGTL